MLKRLTIFVPLMAAAALAQQPPQYGEKVNVNVVLLDAVVTDARGHQILGLGKDDFIVRENGAPQSIDSVDYFTNRRLLDQPESKAAFKAEHVREERYFIFFFDKPTNSAAFFDRLSLARRAVKDFAQKQMKPTDLAAVVVHDIRLKIYSDFTSDKKQLERAVDATAMYGPGMTRAQLPEGAPSILRGLSSDFTSNTGTVYEALRALGDALAPIHSRKEVILFSLGIHEPDEIVQNNMVMNTSRFYAPMVGSLNRADVSVYPINLLGGGNEPMWVHQTLGRIADDTNGEYFQFSTSFSPALKRIEQQTNGYYLITYTPTPLHTGSGFQKVDVSLRNPEFRVRARRGYSYGE